MLTRLSRQQLQILKWLNDAVMADQDEKWWGVPWRLPRLTRAQHASISRALLRLEQRGFVVRQNQVSGRPGPDNEFVTHMRTTHVQVLAMPIELRDWPVNNCDKHSDVNHGSARDAA